MNNTTNVVYISSSQNENTIKKEYFLRKHNIENWKSQFDFIMPEIRTIQDILDYLSLIYYARNPRRQLTRLVKYTVCIKMFNDDILTNKHLPHNMYQALHLNRLCNYYLSISHQTS